MVDEDEYAEGFMWLCYEKLGNDEGCKFTKRKTKANIVQKPVVVTPVMLLSPPPSPPSAVGLKRKVEEQIIKPGPVRRENCQTIYETSENVDNACIHSSMGSENREMRVALRKAS
jgi:hypothetical protein